MLTPAALFRVIAKTALPFLRACNLIQKMRKSNILNDYLKNKKI